MTTRQLHHQIKQNKQIKILLNQHNKIPMDLLRKNWKQPIHHVIYGNDCLDN